MTRPLTPDVLEKMNAWWHAANYLSVGQIYLLANPLLREPLKLEHIKPRLLGHWGTTPGLNFVYLHMNRAIKKFDLDAIFVTGPGHGGPGLVANTYLEGTYSEVYNAVSQDEEGLKRLFRQFSFPGGIPSHVAPETPGSIHEGGELGYSLAHAFGAAFDNPDLFVCCVVGDGEAETGPLATGWHSNKFLNPVTDGAVLPILHLNGYKIANPTVLARIPHRELDDLLRGYGWAPHYVEGDDPDAMHQLMAATVDDVVAEIKRIQTAARVEGVMRRPVWPMIVLRTPKGWTGPKEVDGKPVEDTWRAHQVPIDEMAAKPGHVAMLEELDEELQARGALRRGGEAPPRDRRARAEGRAAHGRQSSCQRRTPPQGPQDAGFRVLRRVGARARQGQWRGHPHLGRLPPRRDEAQPRGPQFPHVRTRRNGLQPPRRGLRGHRQDVAGGDAPDGRTPGPQTAGSWKS